MSIFEAEFGPKRDSRDGVNKGDPIEKKAEQQRGASRSEVGCNGWEPNVSFKVGR